MAISGSYTDSDDRRENRGGIASHDPEGEDTDD